jgi:Domain of unknown function (DUF4160)
MEASLSIEDAAVLAGSLPKAKLRLVQAWIEIHRDELMADWNLALEGQPLFPIQPLR